MVFEIVMLSVGVSLDRLLILFCDWLFVMIRFGLRIVSFLKLGLNRFFMVLMLFIVLVRKVGGLKVGILVILMFKVFSVLIVVSLNVIMV